MLWNRLTPVFVDVDRRTLNLDPADASLGAMQVFSFSGTKAVTAAEGGIVACATPELAGRIEKLRGYGFLYDVPPGVVAWGSPARAIRPA